MWDFLNGWAGQLAGAAGVVLALAGIFGLGFKIGVRERDLKSDAKIAELETFLAAARRESDGWRSSSLMWEQRYKELAGQPQDRSAQHKLDEIRTTIKNGKSLWLRPVTQAAPPVHVSDGGKPIITIANLKGGVGKTTFATHLAYAFAETRKVLFIDLDYQGTGSSLLLRAAGINDPDLRSRAANLLKQFTDYSSLQPLPIPLGHFAPNLSVISAHYELADMEEALMLKWLIGDEPGELRYNLSRALQSPAFQHDMVIIDGPPRLSTALAEALAASTHVVIPTQLERKSTEAALYFATIVREFATRGINPRIEVLGAVPNMTVDQNRMATEETAEISYLSDQLQKILPGTGHVWESTPIYDRIAFSRPNLVFSQNGSGAAEAARSIRRLATRIAGRVGIEIANTGN